MHYEPTSSKHTYDIDVQAFRDELLIPTVMSRVESDKPHIHRRLPNALPYPAHNLVRTEIIDIVRGDQLKPDFTVVL